MRRLVVLMLVVAGAVVPARQPSSLDALARRSLAQLDGTITVPGLERDVQVVRDTWGVPHIYARSTDDLFFAEGYVMAQDRLWQMEMWRRGAEGRLAEVLGPAAVPKDRLARLLRYRGPMDEREFASYHPEGRRIMTAFVNGVNAFIASHADTLPVEFVLTGIKPDPWTIDTLVLRPATFGDAAAELQLARGVAQLGAEEANRRRNPDPWDPLDVPKGLDVSIIGDEVIAATRGAATPKPEILPQYRSAATPTPGMRPEGSGPFPPADWRSPGGVQGAPPTPGMRPEGSGPFLPADWRSPGGVPGAPPTPGMRPEGSGPFPPADWRSPGGVQGTPPIQTIEPGSNNWVVSGALSATGKPVVANDPHREVTNPSLRYIVHLNAPGWNVVGAGEPPFVGVAIGHNERIAWGLTIVGTDQQDVYVEELNPSNQNEVKWNGGWEPLRVVREDIRVKGQAADPFEIKISRHGPIFYVDRSRNRAYAVRSALLEPGAAPYLANLRLAQVKDCREFLDAAMYWKYPTENLICGDVDGNISWQASALTPSRKGWAGRLPVPGTGEYEWDVFRKDLPRELNPARGFIATANHNIQPKGYAPPIMFKTADMRFDRITRLLQMLQPGHKYTMDDNQKMQHDAFSLRAAADAPLFAGWTATDPDVERARAEMASWDHVFTRDSRAAALYETWRTAGEGGGRGRGAAPTPARDEVEARLRLALATLARTQGPDRAGWRWGRIHMRAFPHPFVAAFNLPTVERAGGAGTVAADGATYREIMDVSNWDRSVTINVPGQSGQPGSPYSSNLLAEWAENRYFPMVYSAKAVDRAAAHRLLLKPKP